MLWRQRLFLNFMNQSLLSSNCSTASLPPIHCWWEYKIIQPLYKRVWQFLTNLKIVLLYNPVIALLGFYPIELKTWVHTKTCAWMFIAAFFNIGKNSSNWDVLQQVNRWANSHIYLYIILFSEKKNTMSYWATRRQRWILNTYCEKSDSEKVTCCMIPAIWLSGKDKTRETVRRWVVSIDQGNRRCLIRWSTQNSF